MAVYILERIDIIGGGRGKFIELIRTTWARYAEIQHGVRLAGVWATVGSTAAWPEATLMWEMDDWAHFAAASAAMYPMEDKDPLLNEMWRQALAWRSGGHSALLVPTAYTPTVAQLKAAGAPGDVFIYEDVKALPDKLGDYHAALEREYLPLAKAQGIALVGAYAHAIKPNVGVNLWALRDWDHYARTMEWLTSDPGAAGWQKSCRALLETSEGWILAAPPAQALRT
jgi:hypothetical protein